MAKLYWAFDRDDELWRGPCETDEECQGEARFERDDLDDIDPEIWIAPVFAEKDDDEAFWAVMAAALLWHVENVEQELTEDGWLDPEAVAFPRIPKDRDRILANALRQVLGPRPEWRTVDTAKARRVEL